MLGDCGGRGTQAEVDAAVWQASSSPEAKFGLHQPQGGNCHQESRELMGWIYALISTFLCGAEGEVTFWGLFSITFN